MTLEAYTLIVSADSSCEECCGGAVFLDGCPALDASFCTSSDPIPPTLYATATWYDAFTNLPVASVSFPINYLPIQPGALNYDGMGGDYFGPPSGTPGWYGCVESGYTGVFFPDGSPFLKLFLTCQGGWLKVFGAWEEISLGSYNTGDCSAIPGSMAWGSVVYGLDFIATYVICSPFLTEAEGLGPSSLFYVNVVISE